MSQLGTTIRDAQPSDVDAFNNHMKRQIEENGNGITPIYMVLDLEDFKPESEKIKQAWSKNSDHLGWRRNWVIADKDKIVGNIQIDGAKIKASSHRVTLSMGIEEKYRGAGLGEELMTIAINWVKKHPIGWIDLWVFEHNKAAIKLYEKFGFERVGFEAEKYRFRGHLINNLNMVLKI